MPRTATVDPVDALHPRAVALLRCDDAGTRRLSGELADADTALADHGAGVAAIAAAVGTRLRFGPERLATLCRAALLHDIGKRFVPRALLDKPHALSAAERRVVEGHATVGSMLLLQEGLLAEASIVRHHHERWDGTGYPGRMRGQEIPLEARIIFAADTYDAMTSNRPYRVAMSREAALYELRRCAGSQLDPECVALVQDVLA